MTRELKLALVVGFSLLLVVTVLISDHLSKARTTELSKDIPESPAMTPKPPRENLLASGAGPANPIEPRPTEPTPTGTLGANLPAPGAAPSPEESKPFEIHQGSSTPSTGLADALAKNNDEGIIVPGKRGVPAMGNTSVPTDGLGQLAGQVSGTPTTPDKTPVTSKPTTVKPEADTTKLAGGPVVNKPATQEAPAANGQMHTVAAGDNLSKISRRYYGDSKHWKMIAEANPSAIGKNGEIRVGAKLTIPALETKPSQPSTTPKTAPAVPERAVATKTDPAKKELPKTVLKDPKVKEVAKADRPVVKEPVGKPEIKNAKVYTVRTGDTLSQIAQRELGSASRVKDIVHLNTDVLGKDQTAVRVGMVLKMPKA